MELLLEALELFGIGIKKVPVFMPGKYSVTEKMSNPLNTAEKKSLLLYLSLNIKRIMLKG